MMENLLHIILMKVDSTMRKPGDGDEFGENQSDFRW